MGTRPIFASLVRFGDFELDLRSGELRRDGKAVSLAPQPVRVLALLVSRAGEVVSRQEIVLAVWGAETFVDYEQGLNFAVRQIRNALADDADHPTYIETLHKRGYRFVAEVEKVSDSPAQPSEPPQPISRTGVRRFPFAAKWALVAVIVVLGAGLAALTLRTQWQQAEKASSPPIRSIAVLPLANLSADPAQDYFTEGLTDELTTELAKLKSIRVISRTSAMTYKEKRVPAPQIGRELGADALIEGTVERVGGKVRIRAQLIHAASDRHLWAETYDGDTGDILQVEREVASDIARQIGQLSSDPNKPSHIERKVSVLAHDDYLRGRYYWNKRTEAGLRRGIEYFQKAIDEEPDYALAYSGLADSYIMLANWGFASGADAYPKAKAAAMKAVELDDQLAEAQTSLAYVTLLYDRNWKEAEDRFRQAIALNPSYASAHHFYSILLVTAGRNPEAVAEIRRAQELDPLSLIVNDVVGWIYYENREYEQAVAQYGETLQMDPNYAPALLDESTALMRLGQYNRALGVLQKARTITGDNGVVLSSLAQAYALSGDRGAAQEILRRVHGGQIFMSEWDLALVYLALGDKLKAIALLSRAADNHTGWMIRLGVDPAFDGIHHEPAFQRLVRRVGVPMRA